MEAIIARSQLISMYLSNLNVTVTEIGFNKVGPDWRDIDYLPEFNRCYFIVDGEGWLKVGEQELYPKPGQIALMPAGIKQSFSTISSDCYTKYWCHFTAKAGNMNLFDLIQIPWLMDVNQNELPMNLFQEMLQEKQNSNLSASLNIKSCLLKLIGYYLDHSSQVKIQEAYSNTSQILRAALTYIDEHFHRKITVFDLAALTHLHPNSFIRLFKKHIGTSPIQYINRIRMDHVKWLLTTTDYSLAEIGERSGFPDTSYLSRMFKETSGFSPTTYRSMFG